MQTPEVELPIDLLPKRLQEFVELIGLPDTLKILERHRGRRLLVPSKPSPDHPLAILIGLDKMTVLCGRYGGSEHFDIPKAEQVTRFLRDATICGQYGVKSAALLAEEHDLTERQVFKIVARCNQARKQAAAERDRSPEEAEGGAKAAADRAATCALSSAFYGLAAAGKAQR